MVREGYYFGLPPFVLGLLALTSTWQWGTLTGCALVALGLFVFYFFRDPQRTVPTGEGLVVSPADGRVVVVKEEENTGRPGNRISIFLAIWNVHVNRAPLAGTIVKLEYKPGKFLAAWAEKASLENEQNVFTLVGEHGEIVFKQIAGWVARRVVSWKKAGEVVERGERVGLVRFGSRVDVWLPGEAKILVKVGESVKGGSSPIARIAEPAGVPRKAGNHSGRANEKSKEDQGAA
jgi:phosphatidylserine decarboxylase